MKRSRLLGPLLSCLLLGALGGHASAAATGEPSSQPKTTGPVALDGSQCSDQAVRSDSGTLLGTAEVCLFLYSFDNLSELDLLRDYGAGWLQARFVPASGWCATEVGADLRFEGGRLEQTSRSNQARKVRTRLKLDAGGEALEEAKIAQGWTAAPGSIETAAAADGTAVSSTWSGRSAKPVSLVSGLGYSYEILTGPPEKISYGFSKFALTSC